MTDSNDSSAPGNRRTSDRRGFFRGGRRQDDWPATLTEPLRCPRCQSPEARFIEGTPDTLFWQCHACRHSWSTNSQGRPID